MAAGQEITKQHKGPKKKNKTPSGKEKKRTVRSRVTAAEKRRTDRLERDKQKLTAGQRARGSTGGTGCSSDDKKTNEWKKWELFKGCFLGWGEPWGFKKTVPGQENRD